MQSVVIFIAVVVFGCVGGEDECMPPKPGSEKLPVAMECCDMQKIMPASIKQTAQKCMGSVPHPPKPSGPPPSGGMPSSPPKEMADHHACMAQCIFSENKLIKDDKTIDEAAVKTLFTSDDKDFKPVVEAAVTKCLASYKSKIDKTLNCTSGAAELEECALRDVITNCPNSAWTSNADCDKLKAKLTKCPNLPVISGALLPK